MISAQTSFGLHVQNGDHACSAQSQQGSKYFKVALNRTEMADYLQSNRSAMTRELAEMKAEGLIDFDGDTFTLK